MNVMKMTKLRILSLSAAAIVNFAIILILYSTIYNGNSERDFFVDFKEHVGYYTANFLIPSVLAAACVLAIFLRKRRMLDRYQAEYIPFMVLVIGLISNYILVNGVGIAALSAPFVLLAWIFSFRDQKVESN